MLSVELALCYCSGA